MAWLLDSWYRIVVEDRRPVHPTSDSRVAGRDPAASRPAGICHGAGHVVVYGNEAFRSVFGGGCVGLPAREGLIGLPPAGFAVLDAVLGRGRPEPAGFAWAAATGA